MLTLSGEATLSLFLSPFLIKEQILFFKTFHFGRAVLSKEAIRSHEHCVHLKKW